MSREHSAEGKMEELHYRTKNIKADSRRINPKMPASLIDQIHIFAETHKISRAEVIRRAVKQFLQLEPPHNGIALTEQKTKATY